MSDSLPNSPVLVTGANGFIGSALCAGLRRAGCQVRGLILANTPRAALDALKVEVHEGDICAPESLGPCLSGVRTVFHLAALASDWAPVGVFMRVNAGGTQNVLRAARAAGVERLVHMSSLAVHPFSGHRDADEAAPVGNAVNGYCSSKVAAEALVARAARESWFETTVIRPGAIIFGPGDRTAFVHLAPVLERGFMPLAGGGRQLTCYSFVDNLVGGMILAAGHPAAVNQTFVLTDDARISLREYLRDVGQALGVRPRFVSIPVPLARAAAWLAETAFKAARAKNSPPINRYRAGLVSRDFHFRCDKAKTMLAYRPELGREEGLRRTVDWYRKLDDRG